MRTKIFFLVILVLIANLVISIHQSQANSLGKIRTFSSPPYHKMAQIQVDQAVQGSAHSLLPEQNVSFINQIGGAVSDIFVQGNYLYTSYGPRLQVVDISNPASPQFVGQTALLPDVFSNIFVNGSYAYLAVGESGLHIVDVSNPANPVVVGTYDTPRIPVDIFVSGSYAYIVDTAYDINCDCYEGDILILNVSNPGTPALTGVFDAETPYGVFVVNAYAYVADRNIGLRILDVSNPGTPIEVGTLTAPPNGFFHDIQVSGDYAYVLGWDGYLRIINVSDVASPVEMGAYSFGYAPELHIGDMVNKDGYLFIAEVDAIAQKLWVFDVNDPANPVPTGSYETPYGPREVFVLGNYVYTVDVLENRLYILDINEPANPSLAGFYDSMFSLIAGMVFQEDYAFIGGPYKFYVVNITDPANLVIVAIHETPGFSARVVYTNENYLYVRENFIWPPQGCSFPCHAPDGVEDGIRIYDVSDPEHPVEVGFYPQVNIANELVLGNYLYLITSYEFQIIDVSNPANPVEVGVYDTGDHPENFVISGAYAYIAHANLGLLVLDISDPTQPALVGSFDKELGSGEYVFVIGNYAYLRYLDVNEYAIILDISDPTNPVEVGSYSQCVYIDHASGKYAFGKSINWDTSGDLCILDFSDPLHPAQVGSFPIQYLGQISYEDGYIYFGAQEAGLWIFRFYWPVTESLYLPVIAR